MARHESQRTPRTASCHRDLRHPRGKPGPRPCPGAGSSSALIITVAAPMEQPEPEPGPEPEPVGPEVPDCHPAWHISTDLAGWASLVSNVSGEFDFACRWSLNLNLRYSAWNYGKTTQKFRTFEFRPQVRYWFAPGHNRWFVEAHLSMISYNVALPGWDYRIQDRGGKHPALGGGIGAGYRLPFRNPHWGMEFTVGAGVYNLDYDRFENRSNGPWVDRRKRTFYGIDNVAFSICYTFDVKRKN